MPILLLDLDKQSDGRVFTLSPGRESFISRLGIEIHKTWSLPSFSRAFGNSKVSKGGEVVFGASGGILIGAGGTFIWDFYLNYLCEIYT